MVIHLNDYRETFIAIVDENDPEGLHASVVPTAAFKENPRRFLTSPGQRVHGVFMRNFASAAAELAKLFHAQITDFTQAPPQASTELLKYMLDWVGANTDPDRLFSDIDFDVTVNTDHLTLSA